mgnify:CR=1 FL=1
MSKILVMGHKNPDTDSICSAIAYANLKKELGFEVEAVRLGTISKETQFILDYLSIDAPRLIEGVNEGDKIILVDHNEEGQSVNNRDAATILEIVDHHKIDLSTNAPLNIRMEAICSTASVLFKMYKEAWFEISKEIWTMILAWILSDSLLFKSATTTKEDVLIAEELKKITWIEDLEKFAMPMFDAKSDLGDMPAEDIVKYDYKEFLLYLY